MFKMFAIMCILINGQPQCTEYSDSMQQTFADQISCEQMASTRFYEMMDGFIAYNIPFEEIVVGCKKEETN